MVTIPPIYLWWWLGDGKHDIVYIVDKPNWVGFIRNLCMEFLCGHGTHEHMDWLMDIWTDRITETLGVFTSKGHWGISHSLMLQSLDVKNQGFPKNEVSKVTGVSGFSLIHPNWSKFHRIVHNFLHYKLLLLRGSPISGKLQTMSLHVPTLYGLCLVTFPRELELWKSLDRSKRLYVSLWSVYII